MPRRIEEDHQHYRRVIKGETNRALRRNIKRHNLWRHRAKGGKLAVPIDLINIPHFTHGDSESGVGRGPGKPGDVIQKGKPGRGGDNAGNGHKKGTEVTVDLEYILKFLGDELELPPMKPKTSQTFEEVKHKYNSISKQGPRSLRNMKKTLLRALQRESASGDIDNLQVVPGLAEPVKLITPINDDFRYNTYKEIKIPTSNAAIIFARDCSGSMSDEKCDIVSDMAWWIDVWIRQFYKRTVRAYYVHDTEAEEVDEQKFYSYRHGGGTRVSSVFGEIAKQFKDRFPPETWNIYVFYFTDGDNWRDDTQNLLDMLHNYYTEDVVNFVGLTQILCTHYNTSVNKSVEDSIEAGLLKKGQIRLADVGGRVGGRVEGYGSVPSLTEEARNEQITKAIKKLLGAPNKAES